MYWNWQTLIDKFIEKNSQINLSAIRDAEWIYLKHIQDSLELNKIFDLNRNYKVADIWTWSGFPLMPLAISNPNSEFNGIESTNKKVKAVNDIIESAWITNAKVIWTRAEEHHYVYNVVTARAVAYIDKLLEWSYHLLGKWWYFIFFKPVSEEEKKELLKLCKKYKLDILKTHRYKLFEEDIERIIYVLKKN